MDVLALPLQYAAGDRGGQRGGRGQCRAPRVADGGAADRAGAESRLRFYVNGNGWTSGRRRNDVARAEVCREDEVREVRGLAELILPSQRDAEEGTGGFDRPCWHSRPQVGLRRSGGDVAVVHQVVAVG